MRDSNGLRDVKDEKINAATHFTNLTPMMLLAAAAVVGVEK